MDIIEHTKKLGLNVYEAKIYLALLERDSLSVADIAKISRVPRGRIYDVLESLMVEGLAVLKPGKVKQYSATNPIVLQDKLENRIEEEYKEQKKEINKAVLVLKKEFESKRDAATNDGNPLEYIQVLKNPFQTFNKFLELINKTQKEILIFSRAPYIASKSQAEEQARAQFDARERGVVIRGIYETPPEEIAYEYFASRIETRNYPNPGDEARVIDKLPIKLVVFDEFACMFTLEDPVESAPTITSLVTEHKAMAISFKFLFESFWEKAKDYFIAGGKKYYLKKMTDKL